MTMFPLKPSCPAANRAVMACAGMADRASRHACKLSSVILLSGYANASPDYLRPPGPPEAKMCVPNDDGSRVCCVFQSGQQKKPFFLSDRLQRGSIPVELTWPSSDWPASHYRCVLSANPMNRLYGGFCVRSNSCF